MVSSNINSWTGLIKVTFCVFLISGGLFCQVLNSAPVYTGKWLILMNCFRRPTLRQLPSGFVMMTMY